MLFRSTGEIQQAALYDRALTGAEIATSFKASGHSIPTAEILAALTPDQKARHEAATTRARRARETLDAIEPTPVSYAGKRVQPSPTRRLRRGDVRSPEEVVTAAALRAIPGPDPDFKLSPEAPEAARRLKFAEWLADRRNPLPARVMANRIWQFHFGQGLVATPNDLGASGARPTHPELLDWLAVQFMENGWSMKALHRLITLSATYRQSSASNPAAAAKDADNQWLWR